MADNGGWWHSHYRWVIMVIVLIIGFGLVAAVGVWLRRRHDLKRGRLLGPGQVYGNPIVAPPPKGIPSGLPSAAQSQSGVLPPPISVSSQAARSVPVSTASSSRTNIPPSRTPPPKQVLPRASAAASVEFRPQETRQVPP